MARNVIYRWEVTNDVGWIVGVEVLPSADYSDRTSNSLFRARVVKIPDEAIEWDSFPVIKRGFGQNSPRPIGMVEQDSLELVWNLDILEEAADAGYPDGADLVDLVTYLIDPTTVDGAKLDLKADGSVTNTVPTGNWIRVYVKTGTGPFTFGQSTPVPGKISLFEGVQTEVDAEDMVFSDSDGLWQYTMRVRHWWPVALEQIPVDDLAVRFINDNASVDSSFRFDYLYYAASAPFAKYTQPDDVYTQNSGIFGESARMRQWIGVWSALEDLLSDWIDGHLRGSTIYNYVRLKSPLTNSGGAPTDLVTLYKLDYTSANDKGTALNRGEWNVTSEFFLENRTGGSDETAPGGLAGEGADWGIRTQKTCYDIVQMCVEQSLAKAVPVLKGHEAGNVEFHPILDSPYDEATDIYSPEALTIYPEDIEPSGNRTARLREGIVQEAESGINEGSGDDLETVSFKATGHDQTDGFNLPFFVHNMPKVGDASNDRGIKKHRFLAFDYLKSGYRVGVQNSPGYEACLWYRELSPPTNITDKASVWCRVHGSPDIDLGNGITRSELLRTALPTEKDDALLPALLAAAALEEQATTSWAYVAANGLTSYLGLRKAFVVQEDIPGEKGLPLYVGSVYTLVDADGNPKGLRAYRTASALTSYPTKAIMTDTELNVRTGRATSTFYANYHLSA